jgi:SAM-dependent methyltransferase
MDIAKQMWNELYKELSTEKPKVDDWLDKYDDILTKSNDTPIVDLGCGFGNDTLYLTQKSLPVLSCDYCQNALDRLHYFIENPNTLLLDIREPLPFVDNSTSVIISDLTLHYFDDATTRSIIKEVYRVLSIGGTLLCRVNSIKELQNEKHTPEKIASNYYKVGNKLKRYFDTTDVKHYFCDFTIDNMSTYIMYRYQAPKHILELSATKIK